MQTKMEGGEDDKEKAGSRMGGGGGMIREGEAIFVLFAF